MLAPYALRPEESLGRRYSEPSHPYRNDFQRDRDRVIHARAFREQLERVKATPKVPEWERIATEIRIVAERVVHGDLTVAQATRELDARTDRILEKRRWMLAREASR